MNLHQNLSNRHKGLSIFFALIGVLSLWCIILPPTDFLEYELKQNKIKEIEKDLSLAEEKSLRTYTPDLHSWDLPLIPHKIQKSIELIEEPKKLVQENIKTTPVTLQIPNTTHQPYVSTFNFPPIKYLGQVIDEAGLQIFLAIDDSNVIMRPKKIYEDIWQIIFIDDYEIHLKHIPTQKILRISKS